MTNSLISYPNPDSRKKWLITVETTAPQYIMLRFIPDKLIIDHNSAQKYLNLQLEKKWPTPEEMILKIIEDMNNVLIPKWIEVTFKSGQVTVTIEDKQLG